MTLTSHLVKTISNRLGTPETTQLAPYSSKSVQEITKHGSFLLKEAAIFDSPKGGLNVVKTFEPYDFIIIQHLNLRFPSLTQFEVNISPNDIMNRTNR